MMNDNAEKIKKDMEDNKELLNLSDKEKRVYEAAFIAIANKPVHNSPPIIQVVLMVIIAAAMIVGIIQIAS